MSSDKEQRNKGIVPAGNRGLTRYTSLIDRGLDLAKELDKSEAVLEFSSQTTEITKPQSHTWRCVYTLTHTLSGNSYYVVWSAAISPDGQILASGSVDGTIKLWQLATGQELCTITGHSEQVWSVSFSPDGQTLASSSADNTIKLWQVDNGNELCILSSLSGFSSVAFSPDGQIVAGGSWDGTVKLWQMETGKELYSLVGHSNWVYSVAFSPNGQALASGSADSTIKLWHLEAGKEIRTLAGHSSWVKSITFSPDGQLLASSSFSAYSISHTHDIQ